MQPRCADQGMRPGYAGCTAQGAKDRKNRSNHILANLPHPPCLMQIKDEAFVEDINNLLNAGEVRHTLATHLGLEAAHAQHTCPM